MLGHAVKIRVNIEVKGIFSFIFGYYRILLYFGTDYLQ